MHAPASINYGVNESPAMLTEPGVGLSDSRLSPPPDAVLRNALAARL
jgi:hypothetical protein